ncbi:MAG TPA: hypothetical protein VK092_04995, partial [Deinococcales bacterium]|nr:hypothetical protein [Deinococcales bacterium]
NRQLRRAQEKQQKKLEKEQEDRKAERRRRLNRYRAERDQARARREKQKKAARGGGAGAKAAGGKQSAPVRTADPGRFSGALTIATVFFILLQSVVPTESERLFDSFIKGGFYLALGYFLHLWLSRRQLPRAFVLTVTIGVMVLTGTWIGHLLRPDAPLDALGMLLSLPFLVLGTWLGQLVINLAESQNRQAG